MPVNENVGSDDTLSLTVADAEATIGIWTLM